MKTAPPGSTRGKGGNKTYAVFIRCPVLLSIEDPGDFYFRFLGQIGFYHEIAVLSAFGT
jgi:hypothetical protein